jgi:4-diphosphocytidyl-2-C-methyl-D-erythritol kinase
MFSNAKINLGLFVLNKREDGYHTIASLKFPIPLTDVIEILPATSFSLQIIGKEIAGRMEDNLIWKAYNLISTHHSISPVKIILQKNIPMGAGLGGGSSNASFVLKGLNEYYQLNLTDEKLKSYASELGSDCPFFIANTPQLASSKGEILSPFDFSLKGYYLYLVDSQIHIGTAEAYAGVKPYPVEFDWNYLKEKNFSFWKEELKNDFEDSIFPKYPELASLKQKLYDHGALYASMTGSGSAMFGIFKVKPEIFNSSIGQHRVFEL